MSLKLLISLILSLLFGLFLTVVPFWSKVKAQSVNPPQVSFTATPQLAQSAPLQFTCIPEATVTTDYPAGKISYCRQKSFPQGVNDSARVDIKPGASRTPHWHDTWEQQFLISGRSKLYLVDPKGRVYTEIMNPGTISVVPNGWTHWNETIGDKTAELLLIFPVDFQTFEVSDSVAQINPQVMKAIMGTSIPNKIKNSDPLVFLKE